MIKKLTLLLFFISNITFAQIPAGYYNTATGTGYTLKTQLYNIIKNNTNSSSNSSYNDLWTLYTTSAFRDYYYENNGTLLDIYSEKPSGPDSYEYSSTSQQCGNYSGEGSCYNREHIVPQSVFNSNYPMYSDAHFVLPSDGYVNGKRSNYPFGKVNAASWTSTNGSKLGSNLNSGYSAGYIGTVFEPIDEFKGDVARAILYFATRYQDVVSGFSFDMFDGSSTKVFTETFKSILLTWNTLDPVSAYEIAKNNQIYYSFQGNRNPFIDHPEWVGVIWGNPLAIDENQNISFKIYPNPSSEFIIIENSNNLTIEKYEIYSAFGRKVISDNYYEGEKIAVDNLANGIYFITIFTNTSNSTEKIIINH